jgi:hypothetical protein
MSEVVLWKGVPVRVVPAVDVEVAERDPIAVELVRIVRVVAQPGGEPPELGGA